MILAVWLLLFPFRFLAALGLRRSVILACLLVLAVTAYGVAEDLGVLEPPARAAPARKPAAGQPAPSRAAIADIPASYLRLYRQAATRNRIPWSVLAAIGKVESDHGRTRLPGVRSGSNWAGACGPMQLGCVPGSRAGNAWAGYGRGRPYDPANAIPAAARYPVDHGARRNLDRALYAYKPFLVVRGPGQAARRPLRPRGWAQVTAAELGHTDRLVAARSREELRLAQVASGLLLLLDAYRLTGRLPLEVQVQASRLRHAVKLVIQAEAARSPAQVPPSSAAQGLDPAAAALRAWIAAQPWTQPGPVGWVYLLCFRDPATGAHRPLVGNGCRGQYAGHYWGWTDDLIRRIAEHRNPRWRGAGRLVQVALAAGLTFELAWLEYPATRGRERRLKNQGSAYRRCPLCRGTGGPLDPAAAVAAVQRSPLAHRRPSGRR